MYSAKGFTRHQDWASQGPVRQALPRLYKWGNLVRLFFPKVPGAVRGGAGMLALSLGLQTEALNHPLLRAWSWAFGIYFSVWDKSNHSKGGIQGKGWADCKWFVNEKATASGCEDLQKAWKCSVPLWACAPRQEAVLGLGVGEPDGWAQGREPHSLSHF